MSSHLFDMKGHAALITASTGGIGLSIARTLAAAGADVVLNGLSDDEAAQDALEACRSHGVRASLIAADLTGDSASLAESIFAGTIAEQPNVDLLVNHAGGHQGEGAFEDIPVDLLERTLRINVVFPWLLAQRFARHWLASGVRGRMLFTGSINGRMAEQDSAAYDTAKGAVEMMVKTLCVALAPKGIRVNGIAPGIVHSPRTTWLKAHPDRAAWIRGHIPDGRIPVAEDLGASALYLLSDAAEYVNGHMLVVDGGISALQMPASPPAPGGEHNP